MGGISRRAYAKRRGCTEKAIRDRITDGTLADAVLPDGTIDAGKADRLLAEKVTAGKRTGSDLNEARRRKLAAGVALLQDDVRALVDSVVRVDDAGRYIRQNSLEIALRLFRIADDCAGKVAGKEASAAAAILDEAVRAALTDLSGGPTVDFDDDPDSDSENAPYFEANKSRPRGAALDDLTAVQLAALKADLEAHRLETKRALNNGKLVEIERICGELAARCSIVRNRMLGLHVKVAPHFLSADKSEAKTLLEIEISEGVEEMACTWVTKADLTAGRASDRRQFFKRDQKTKKAKAA
ncbi:hypothetical protein B5V02_39345 [Mesorhizobium kowhaii]|uniref:Uncharacterized protein n=2 Tax=Mesorhizobium kowhaii TaxID=1300272 RepID=A0A2W7BRS1_9HYPH|nr:hypothetical protein B5V02_39345 [Mesorhizobium kowhaii]